MLKVAHALGKSFGPVELVLLDRQDIVNDETIDAYAALGWQASTRVVDVRDWAADAALGEKHDLVITTLFLHHFEGAELDAILHAIASTSVRAFACEPQRGFVARIGSRLIGLIGANAVTRNDAILSVQAGFRNNEISARWPRESGKLGDHRARCRTILSCVLGNSYGGQVSGFAQVHLADLPTSNRFDALIVGAGLAGSATAILLARAGWRIALVEKRRFPRRKVCGECLAASNLPLLHALGVGQHFGAMAGPELRFVTYMREGDAIEASLPRLEHGPHPWGRALGRETLDDLLLEQARALGVEILQPFALQSIDRRAHDWHCTLRAIRQASDRTGQRHTTVPDFELQQANSSMRMGHGSPCLRLVWPHRLNALHPTAHRICLPSRQTSAKVHTSAATSVSWRLMVGYGGIVEADNGRTTVACCVRRSRLDALRASAPGCGQVTR